MAGTGGKRIGAGRKSNVQKLKEAEFMAPWFSPKIQDENWKSMLANSDANIRLKAMIYLTDRVYGKPKERVEQSIDMDDLQQMVTVNL